MKSQIYYFSGTGNSLAIVKKLTANLGEAESISMAHSVKVKASRFNPDASVIGLVFPVYAWGPPRMVTDFVKKCQFAKDQYIFGIATCGGTMSSTLNKLNNLVKKSGGKLAAGFAVKTESHIPTDMAEVGIIKLIKNLAGDTIPLPIDKRVNEITDIIKQRQTHKSETNAFWANFLGGMINSMFISTLKNVDKDYWADEKCIACGTCVKVCPRDNIKLDNKKVIWQHNCESCYACLLWCPQQAIQLDEQTLGKERKPNPEVSLEEMMAAGSGEN